MPATKLISDNLQDAIAYHQAGDLQNAQRLYKSILEGSPNDSNAKHLLGMSLFQQGNLEQALILIWESIKIDPQNFLAYTNLGNVFQRIERHQEAINSYDVALAIEPSHADAFFNRGNSMFALMQYESALDSYEQLLVLQPTSAEAHINKGNTLHKLQRENESVTSYNKAISLCPQNAQAYYNRGIALQFMNLNVEALSSYKHAINIKPDYVEALNNQGNTFQNLNLYQNALNAYHAAQVIDPNYGDAHWNEALCRLKLGDYENGWVKYEWRWDNSISNPSRTLFSGKLWDGKDDLNGKVILLYSEQGFGDSIQFFRYVKMVQQRGATVVLQVHSSLINLFKEGSEGVKFISDVKVNGHEYYCPLLSLPKAFNTIQSSIPSSDAYLFSNKKADRIWKHDLGKKTLPRVGLVWSGNKQNTNDRARSISLLTILKLLRADVQWFSLQNEISENDMLLLRQHGVTQYKKKLTSFLETASLIEQMDIVISVDTSVAHLAAALGKPTWILLSHNADFRWLLGRCDSPWYPSVQLFRQPSIEDWDSVILQLNMHMEHCLYAHSY